MANSPLASTLKTLLLGAAPGAVAGAGVGALSAGEDNRLKGALAGGLGGGIGSVAGAIGGAAAGRSFAPNSASKKSIKVPKGLGMGTKTTSKYEQQAGRNTLGGLAAGYGTGSLAGGYAGGKAVGGKKEESKEASMSTTEQQEEVLFRGAYLPAFVEKCASIGIQFPDQESLSDALETTALVKKLASDQSGNVIKSAAASLRAALGVDTAQAAEKQAEANKQTAATLSKEATVRQAVLALMQPQA